MSFWIKTGRWNGAQSLVFGRYFRSIMSRPSASGIGISVNVNEWMIFWFIHSAGMEMRSLAACTEGCVMSVISTYSRWWVSGHFIVLFHPFRYWEKGACVWWCPMAGAFLYKGFWISCGRCRAFAPLRTMPVLFLFWDFPARSNSYCTSQHIVMYIYMPGLYGKASNGASNPGIWPWRPTLLDNFL